MKKRVLITGGGGFVGTNLAKRLIADGNVVRIIDDFSSGYRRNLVGVDAELVEGTILDPDLTQRVCDGIDSIVHLAALGSVPRSVANPRASFEANAVGTLNVLEASRLTEVNQVIVASSSSVYGSNPSLPRRESDWIRPLSPYAASKAATEALALSYGNCYELDVLAFRFFNIFGPYQAPDHPYAAVIPRFLDAAIHGRPLEVHGDGLQSRDFTYVSTVVDVLASALNRGTHAPGPVNLAFGTDTSLLDLIAEIEEVLNASVHVEHTDARAGDVRASQSDGELIRDLFPEVTPVSLRTGIEQTVEWFETL